MRGEEATIDVVDNPAESRFESHIDGALVVADYVRRGDTIIFTHTLVPEELRGRGIGSALARGALEKSRENGWQVVPRCPFIAAYIQQHPEYRSVER